MPAILLRFAPWLLGAALILLLAWRYAVALEDIGRLETERRELLATNEANAAAIERLGSELARREQLRRDIANNLQTVAVERDALKTRLEQVNADAPEDFRECLAVALPAGHISLQQPADQN